MLKCCRGAFARAVVVTGLFSVVAVSRRSPSPPPSQTSQTR